MRVRLGPRSIGLAASVSAVFLAVGLSFGPIVRAAVAREAARRHVVVGVGGVRPGWWAVRLIDVDLTLTGVHGIALRAGEVLISLGLDLRPLRVDVYGLSTSAAGAEPVLRQELVDWAKGVDGVRAPEGGRSASARTLELEIHDGSATWSDGAAHPEGPSEPRLAITGIAALSDVDGFHVSARQVRAQTGRGSLVLDDALVDLTRSHLLRRARAAAAVVEWSAADLAPAESPARKEREPAAAPVAPVRAASAPATGQVRRRPAPVDAEARAPLLPLPDLRALRATSAAAGAALAALTTPDADIGADAVTWKISRPSDRVAFTLGPGALSLRRDSGAVGLRFVASARGASTPLSLDATLPLEAGDVTVKLDGGPVSLGLLGVGEGALGLVDVDRAMVSGRARVVLSSDGADPGVLTFDVEAKTGALSIDNSRLASEAIRDVDLGIVARGVATASGELRLDDLEIAIGRTRIDARGVLHQATEHVDGDFHFAVPETACQALLDSVPRALLPTVHGARDEGTFGLDGRVVFDTRTLDDLSLVYDVRDRCRLVEVPAPLARERFDQPFIQRVVLPDGTVGERTTGPGSDNWTPLEEISPYMQVAVLTTEDGAFPRHHGFNHAAIRSALIANLKARRFVRGASTITMQLAKNLFLGREKTLSRKLEEMILTDYLEQTFSKDELMELYLNVIEFGPAVYGVRSAADYYFGRTPAELNLAECLFLSSILPSPIRYGAMRSAGEAPESWMRTLHMLMEISHRTHRISDAELADGESEPVVFWVGGDRPAARPAVQARSRFDGEMDDATTVPVSADSADGP